MVFMYKLSYVIKKCTCITFNPVSLSGLTIEIGIYVFFPEVFELDAWAKYKMSHIFWQHKVNTNRVRLATLNQVKNGICQQTQQLHLQH